MIFHSACNHLLLSHQFKINLANDFQGEAERVLGFVREIINALSIQNARDGCIMSRDKLFYGQNFVSILMQVTNYLMFSLN